MIGHTLNSGARQQLLATVQTKLVIPKDLPLEGLQVFTIESSDYRISDSLHSKIGRCPTNFNYGQNNSTFEQG